MKPNPTKGAHCLKNERLLSIPIFPIPFVTGEALWRDEPVCLSIKFASLEAAREIWRRKPVKRKEVHRAV